MRVVSHPEADEELEAAALWYEERQPDLGLDFLDEFESTLRRMLVDPERQPCDGREHSSATHHAASVANPKSKWGKPTPRVVLFGMDD